MFPVPWGGSIDIGSSGVSLPTNVVLIGDGIGLSTGPLDFFFASNQGSALLGTPPEFVLSLAAGAGLNGGRSAFQGIVQDPTQPPFNLDNTEAADANFVNGQTVTVTALSGSGSTGVPFLAGKSFRFHGQTYSDVWMSANGYINFGGTSSVTNAGFSIDAHSFVGAEPAIALYQTDWETGPNNQILYEELGNTLRIAYGDPTVQPGGLSHYQDTDSNQFEVILELQDSGFSNANDGQFEIRIINSDTTTTNMNGSGLIGHTPGGANILFPARDRDLHQFQASLPGEAMIEEHNNNNSNATVLGWDGVGAARAYNWFHSWMGTNLTFTPQPWLTIPGDAGYTSTASNQAPDDVRGTVPAGLDVSGNEIITIAGKFNGFSDAMGLGGSVVFDPAGLALPGTVVGILDGTGSLPLSIPNNPDAGPFRDTEGLQIVTPVFPGTGPIDMQVNFFSGASFTITVNVVAPGTVITNYSVSAGGSVHTHALQMGQSIDFYGTTYTQMFLHGHGYITFGAGASDFSETMPEFFAGWQAAGQPMPTPNPGVAVMWSDLNNNSGSAVVEVAEDMATGATTVSFLNQAYWQTGSPAGNASVTFNFAGPNSLAFDYTGYLPETAASGNTHNTIIGMTDGDDSIGSDTDMSDGAGTGIFNNLGLYTSTMGPDSIGELIPTGVGIAATMWTAVDGGDGTTTPYGTWSIF